MPARLLFLLLIILSCNSDSSTEKLKAPVAKQVVHRFSEFGQERNDPYLWLSHPEDPAVIQHLKAENTYTESMLAHTKPLQEKILAEIIARMEQEYSSLPVKKNGYWYYERFVDGKQYPIYCRKKGSRDAPEEIMLDVNRMAQGHQIYLVNGRSVSPDNRLFFFAEDITGGRRCVSRLMDLEKGTMLEDTLPNSSGEFAWSLDNKIIFYTVMDPTVRSFRVMRHRIGTKVEEDVTLYTEKDSTYGVQLSVSRDNRFIFLHSLSTTTSESRYIDASRPETAPVLIQPRQQDLIYLPDYQEGDSFHIFNNHHAKNFKLSTAPIRNPQLGNWKDLIPHQDSALLQRVEVLKHYIVTAHFSKGLPRITVLDRADGSTHTVPFEEEAYVANLSMPTDEYESDSIRVSYSSLTTPESNYGYHLRSRQKTLLKQQKVGGGYQAGKYELKRLWAPATDGTKVPLTIVYRKDKFSKDGKNPLLLYAYGSYGYSSEPDFYSAVFSLLDRGFVYGIAHVRGGQEMGRYWYENGKLLHKKNTFTDFIDCAQYLVNEKYTNTDRLFANGGSAGGMLMGAVINLRPDLFRGVIPEVPWMDVITDMYNADLPLTTLEYDEWGHPYKKEFYDYMLSWSPYDNLKEAVYPAILTTGGLNDTQVLYYSPAKWVQKLRSLNKGTAPVLFLCNMGAGHGGESGRFESQKLTAMKYAFIADLAGIKE